MGIPFSGYNDAALGAAVLSISSDADFAGKGKVFWLRGVLITNTHATDTAKVDLFDQDEAAVTPANMRGSVQCPAKATTMIDFPAPGIKFITEVGAVKTAGTIAAYDVLVTGYME